MLFDKLFNCNKGLKLVSFLAQLRPHVTSLRLLLAKVLQAQRRSQEVL